MSAIHMPELLIGEQTGDEFDYEAAKEIGACRLFQVWLKELDQRLGLLFARPGSRALEGGYWYITRRNDNAPPSYWRVATPTGDPCVPDHSHIEMLQRIDTAAHPDVYRQYRKRQDEARARGEKDAAELHREFREKLDERLRHEFGTQIFVPDRFKDKLAGGAALPGPIADELAPGDEALRKRIADAATAAGMKPTTPPAANVAGEKETSSLPAEGQLS